LSWSWFLYYIHFRSQERSFANHSETAGGWATGERRQNNDGKVGLNNGGSGCGYEEQPPTIKLALNGVRKRAARCGAVKVDLSCADKTIRRPDSAPDLIRKSGPTEFILIILMFQWQIYRVHSRLQCCGSGSESGSIGSTRFWASLIRIWIYKLEVWIRILLSLSKNSKKNLDFYCFVTSF
jgi:hypothetical protein